MLEDVNNFPRNTNIEIGEKKKNNNKAEMKRTNSNSKKKNKENNSRLYRMKPEKRVDSIKNKK